MKKPFIIIICLAAVFVAWKWLASPKYVEFTFVSRQLKEKAAALKEKKAYFEKLAGFSYDLKKYPEQLKKIDSALPEGESLPSVLDFLQKNAAETGLYFTEIGKVLTTLPKENPSLKESRFDISLSGPYSAFKNFLANVEKSSRLIEIEEIKYSYPKEKELSSSFNLKIKFSSAKPSSQVAANKTVAPEINFKLLEESGSDPLFGSLQLFEKIQPFEGEVGRDNPFIPF
ncbi:MAG: type 4a pilus biogenesis protein PilO [Candidatus Pacebacteria bacterium]|nr:type 4a pilus biogenesis protein PilO [Candidatus Paceibacterota bacterium]